MGVIYMADTQPTSLPGEEWRPIPEWEGYYSVSNMGRVRSFDRHTIRSNGSPYRRKGRILKPHPYESGHMHVNLMMNGKQYKWRVHRLVMLAFVGPCPEGMEVCHNNGDPADNRLENLRYDDHSSNLLDRNDHGTCHYRKRTHCPRGHVLALPNLVAGPWKRGHRNCLACNRTSARVSQYPELKPQRQEISDSYYEDIMRKAG